MMHSAPIALVVLAAGASKRMGQPKQLLPWGTSTLLEHSIQTALQAEVKKIFVVLGANHDILKSSIENNPVEIIFNSNWEQGLGSSISKAIHHIQQSDMQFEGVMFMLADQPYITVFYLNTLIRRFKSNNRQIIATSYEHGERGVPVLFDKVYFKELMTLTGDSGAKPIIKAHESEVDIVFCGIKNIDLDTQNDYLIAYQENFTK
ncbi:nucleotidyltransferase family protein [Aestuariibaculum suncheonense]|uniref:Nucleotidyltransferase family protein n=1 Tax=Aestuariibaculum suncheonense TaxID=1028745 RepID=A0A8J6UHJ0_9FLAO|nr:nucleotidyltransferase family protein [Aestuariibaculum suncheonense]MBD0835829.1 nucleotidyltransferase family protein [Aestuariibaculum suncheonense]